MTKETKIGLLVGLAFIILFAIILSEKSGTTRDTALPAFAVADANRKVSSTTGTERPLDGAGVVNVNRKVPPVIDNRPTPPPTAVTAKPPADQPSTPKDPGRLDTESLAHLLNPPDAGADTTSSGDKPKETAVPLGEAVAIALDAAKDTTPQPVVPKVEQPAEKGSPAATPTAAPETTSSDSPAKAEEPKQPAESLPIKTTHEVQPGESLGKIAAKYYGRSTPQRVQAIYNANRDVITNVNAVKATTKLNIPDLGEKNDQFEPVSSFPGTQLADASKVGLDKQPVVPLPIGDRTQPSDKQRGSGSTGRAASAADQNSPGKEAAEKKAADKAAAEKTKPAKSSTETKPGKSSKSEKPAAEKPAAEKTAPEATYEWYEVRQSDTLAKIAARKLGDQKLYSEILRLNKDRINDKNVLKPGVKIRLPAKTASGTQTDTALTATSADQATP